MSTKQISVCFVFESSSGTGEYQTLQYVDGTTSCDCKGWTRRVQPNGSRSCKHTRIVEAGYARRAAKSVVEYSGRPFSKELAPQFAEPKGCRTRQETTQPERDFAFD